MHGHSSIGAFDIGLPKDELFMLAVILAGTEEYVNEIRNRVKGEGRLDIRDKRVRRIRGLAMVVDEPKLV
jgi:hypothetical protein